MAATFLEAGTDATFDFAFYPITAVGGAGSSLTSATDQVYTGPRSIKSVCGTANNSVYCVTKDGAVADAGSAVSVRVRMSTAAPSVFTGLFGVEGAGDGASLICTALDTDGILALSVNTVAGSTKKRGTITIAANTWYRLCESYVITSTTNWSAKLYVNDALAVTMTNADATLETTGSSDAYFGVNAFAANGGTSAAMTAWFDDIYIDNRTDQTAIGDISVTAKLPAANNVNQFSTAIGANPANRWTNVNERTLSETNGWGDNAASTQLENYTLQAASVGDADLSSSTLVSRCAWLWAKQLVAVAGTPGITDNGSTTAITLTTTSALYTKITDSASYPSDVAGIGMRSAGNAADATDLFECGTLIAYISLFVISNPSASSMVGRVYV